jgi:hypothetical protein
VGNTFYIQRGSENGTSLHTFSFIKRRGNNYFLFKFEKKEDQDAPYVMGYLSLDDVPTDELI